MQRFDDESAQFASPACGMHQADDLYMGYAGTEELVSLLNELLAAQPALSQPAPDPGPQPGGTPLANSPPSLNHTRWREILIGHLKTLGQNPPAKFNAADAASAASEDPKQRAWMQQQAARHVLQVLPRVRDVRLHDDLSDLLRSSRINARAPPEQ